MVCRGGWKGGRCHRPTCDVCSDRRSQDWKWSLRESLAAYGQPVLLVTVTAPGKDVLPLGPDGLCAIEPLSQWSGTMMERWHRLKEACKYRAKLPKGSAPVVLASAWQSQKRGAPHLHLVVPAADHGRRFAYALKHSASDYGFGFVDIQNATGSAAAVGNYLCRYLARDLQSRGANPYRDFLPRREVYVCRWLLARSGASLAIARKLRHLWVFANREPSIGVPAFKNQIEESWCYFWYRVGIRGRENVRPPIAITGGSFEVPT